MNIFQKIKSLFTKEMVSEMFYPGFDSTHGLAHTDNYLSMVQADTSWINSCTNLNAVRVAGTPLRLYVSKPTTRTLLLDGNVITKSRRKDLSKQSSTFKYVSDPGKEIIELYEHPFLDLMQNVNSEMNSYELWHLTQKFEDLTGNNYWHVIDNGMGLPQEIYILPSQNVKIRAGKDKFVIEYIYTNGGRDYRIPTEEIIHFKAPSPLNLYYGRGPLAGAVAAANINIMMLQYEEALFTNGGMPATYIDATGLSMAQAKELSVMMKKQFQGPKKAGKLMVGKGKPEKLGFNPKDMNVLIEGKPIKEQIASAFGIPMSMLGTEDVNLANAQAGRMQYAETGLTPRLKMKEQKLNEQLLPRWDSSIFCAFDDVIPEDKEFELKENMGYANKIWTINEIRETQGKDPIEGGDELNTNQAIDMGGMSPEEAAQVAKALESAVEMELNKLDKRIDKVEDEL